MSKGYMDNGHGVPYLSFGTADILVQSSSVTVSLAILIGFKDNVTPAHVHQLGSRYCTPSCVYI